MHFWFFLSLLVVGSPALAAQFYFVDAHSQFGDDVLPETVLSLMDANNVRSTILATRKTRDPETVVDSAERNPGRIIPSVRAKGRKPAFFTKAQAQAQSGRYRAMAELHLYHANPSGGKGAIDQMPSSNAVSKFLALSKKMGWPFVLHIEFAALSQDRAKQYMEEMEELLSSNPNHNFVLIHMAQLQSKEVGRLLSKYPNLYFFPSRNSPLIIGNSEEPWVNIFDGRRLAPEWRALFLSHPNNFIFAMDNVHPKHWDKMLYAEQISLWREALQDLPLEVAELFAHGNAERIWKL